MIWCSPSSLHSFLLKYHTFLLFFFIFCIFHTSLSLHSGLFSVLSSFPVFLSIFIFLFLHFVGCEELASQFLSQEIDGQALLLLKEEHLMSTMNIKLGPALKICAHINNLRDWCPCFHRVQSQALSIYPKLLVRTQLRYGPGSRAVRVLQVNVWGTVHFQNKAKAR